MSSQACSLCYDLFSPLTRHFFLEYPQACLWVRVCSRTIPAFARLSPGTMLVHGHTGHGYVAADCPVSLSSLPLRSWITYWGIVPHRSGVYSISSLNSIHCLINRILELGLGEPHSWRMLAYPRRLVALC